VLYVFSDLLCCLRCTSHTQAVVGTIALDEVGRLRCFIELLLELLGVSETMELQRTGVALLLIELFAQELGEHLVDSEIGEEEVVVREELAFVLVLLEVLLQLRDTDDLGNAWHLEGSQLVLEGACRVLGEDAHTSAMLLSITLEGVRDLDLKRSRGRLRGHLGKSEDELHE